MDASRFWLRTLLRCIAWIFIAMSATEGLTQNFDRRFDEDANTVPKREVWLRQQRGNAGPGARLAALAQFDKMLQAERDGRSKSLRFQNRTFLFQANSAISSLKWNSIGPQPIKYADNSMYSGRVRAIAVDPRNSSVVYAGAATGGVWKTNDGGSTWTELTDTQPSLATGAIALDETNPDVVFVGTGEPVGSGMSIEGIGVLKSTDGGSTWTNLPGPFLDMKRVSNVPGTAIASLAVDPANGQIVLAAAYPGGIFRSVDGGTSWTKVIDEVYGSCVAFDPRNGSVAYAGTWDGNSVGQIFKSVDAGATWIQITDSTFHGDFPNIAIAPSASTTLFASPGGGFGLFKSMDGGATWVQLPNSPTLDAYRSTLAVDPSNPDVVFAGNVALYRSLDGGTTWEDIRGGGHPDFHAITFSTIGDKLYVGNDGGIWSTNDISSTSMNWVNQNSTLNITQFYPGVSVYSKNPDITLGGTQDNGVAVYTGSLQWSGAICGDGGYTAIDPSNSSVTYLDCSFSEAGAVFKSTDRGQSWQNANTGLSTSDTAAFDPPLVVDPSVPQRLYYGTQFLYASNDGAASWTKISTDFFQGSNPGYVTQIAVSPSNSNKIYLGVAGVPARILVTDDALAGVDAQWQERSIPTIPFRALSSVVVDYTNPNTVYASYSGYAFGLAFNDPPSHVFRSVNAGITWADISGNLPNVPVYGIVIDPQQPDTLYVGTDIGVFYTTDGGSQWLTLSNGLPRVPVFGLVLQNSSRILRAATHGRGMWDLVLPSLTPIVVSPASLSFAQQAVGTISAPQTITVTNPASSPVAFSILSSPAFNQSNDCGASLAPSARCSIQVSFVPAGTGARNGSITIQGDTGVLFSIALSGMGVSAPSPKNPDFTLDISPQSASVTDGANAKFIVTISPTDGSASSTVQMECSNLPANASCSFSPSSTTIANIPVTAVLTLSTTSPATTALNTVPIDHAPGFAVSALAAASFVFPIIVLTSEGARRRKLLPIMICLSIAAGMYVLGCGRGMAKSGASRLTPIGTYNIQVVAKSDVVQHSSSIKLQVQ